MLLRETLRSVLTTPGSMKATDHEVTRHVQPHWKTGAASHALVLTGVRRCGKSTLQGQIRRRIKGASVTINLEDTRLYGLGPEDFATMMSVLDADHRGELSDAVLAHATTNALLAAYVLISGNWGMWV